LSQFKKLLKNLFTRFWRFCMKNFQKLSDFYFLKFFKPLSIMCQLKISICVSVTSTINDFKEPARFRKDTFFGICLFCLINLLSHEDQLKVSYFFKYTFLRADLFNRCTEFFFYKSILFVHILRCNIQIIMDFPKSRGLF